jgi:hypothetical protein
LCSPPFPGGVLFLPILFWLRFGVLKCYSITRTASSFSSPHFTPTRGETGKISYAVTYPGASMQSSDLVHPI